MEEAFEEGTFLGLPRGEGSTDIAVVPLAYELTTSYGMGACDGPQACVEASAQVGKAPPPPCSANLMNSLATP